LIKETPSAQINSLPQSNFATIPCAIRLTRMKHKLALLTLCLSVLPAIAVVPQSATLPTTMKFHSDTLHLDYTYPTSFAQRDTSKDTSHPCGVSAISAVDSKNGFRMIILQDDDGVCLNKNLAPSLPDRASRLVNGILKRYGTPSILDVTAYLIGTHHAVTTNGFVFDPAAGRTHYVAVSCQIIDKHAACWSLVTTSCSALTEMERYPITFAGELPAPLIPESLKPECK
jgi:hypothetical protein